MNLFIAGFRGTYRHTAPPNLGMEDNRPDVHDEADFDIPDTQAVLERFMSNMRACSIKNGGGKATIRGIQWSAFLPVGPSTAWP